MPPTAEPAGRGARALRLALIVGLVAFAVRFVYLIEFQSSVFFSVPILDAAWHAGWAHRIAEGRWLDGAPYFRAPLYTWFLAAIEALAGPNPWAPRLMQALLGAVAAALTAVAAERVSPRAGLPAGLVMAGYGPLVFATGELLHEALLVPLLAAWLLVTLHAITELDDADAGVLPWFASALLLGVAAIVRPSALALAPLLLLAPRFARLPGRIEVGRTTRRLLLPVAAGLVLPILPVTAINYIASGDIVLIASQGGINFYAGNNAAADGRHVVIPELADLGGWEDFEPRVKAIAETAAGHTLGTSGVSNWWFDRGVAWIRSAPVDAAALWLRKAGALVCGYEVPNNRDIAGARRDSLLLSLLVGRVGPFFWPWGLLVPLAVLGVATSSGRRRWFLPIGAAGLYGASLLPFFVCDRFRLPIVLFLALPAGAGLAALPAIRRTLPALIRAIPALARAPLAAHARVLAAAAAALILTMVTWGADTRVNAADDWHRLGEALYNAGRPAPSLEAFDQAVRLSPDDEAIRLGRAWAILAVADTLAKAGGGARAATLDSLAGSELARVAGRLPDSWQAQYGYGNWLARHGRAPEAVPFLERAAGAQPDGAAVHRDLGFAYEAVGRWREAGIALSHALTLGEATADVHLSLGLAAMNGGRPDLAENNWRRALELDPRHVRSLANLGSLELGRGRYAEAADWWRRALRVEPDNAPLAARLLRLEAAQSAATPR